MNTAKAIQELTNVNLQAIIEDACKKFTDACFDEGLSVEKTQRLMFSKQGMETIAKIAAKAI